jgi:hypothetical protein
MGNNSSSTADVGRPERSRRRRHLLTEVAITGITLAVGGVGGALWANDGPPAFAGRQQLTVDEVLGVVADAGVQCAETPRLGREASSGQHVTCSEDGRFRFEIAVSTSMGASYQSFDLATSVGCITLDGTRPKKFYVAREANWNLLTYDEALATALLQTPGVTVAVKGCLATRDGHEGLAGPMRPT